MLYYHVYFWYSESFQLSNPQDQLFTYDLMKNSLVSELKTNDFAKLLAHFEMSENQANFILKSNTPMMTLLHSLEERGDVGASDVGILANALKLINPSCQSVVEIYRKTRRKYLLHISHDIQQLLVPCVKQTTTLNWY